MIPVTGFSPSVDPTTPGVLIDVENLIPTNRGMRAALAGEPISPAVPEPVISAFNQKLPDESGRTFACTASSSGGIVLSPEDSAYPGISCLAFR